MLATQSNRTKLAAKKRKEAERDKYNKKRSVSACESLLVTRSVGHLVIQAASGRDERRLCVRFFHTLVVVHLPFRFEEMDKHRKKQKLDLEAREAQAVANRGRAGGAGRDGAGANGQPSINMHVLDELRKLGQKQREDEAKRIEEALRVSGRRFRNSPGLSPVQR